MCSNLLHNSSRGTFGCFAGNLRIRSFGYNRDAASMMETRRMLQGVTDFWNPLPNSLDPTARRQKNGNYVVVLQLFH
jgi:hypothetical protein